MGKVLSNDEVILRCYWIFQPVRTVYDRTDDSSAFLETPDLEFFRRGSLQW